MDKQPSLAEVIAITAILLLAAYLRMGQAGIVEFKRDEANLALLAQDIASGKQIPLLGITSSVGLPNAPVNAYILAAPYVIVDHPMIATQFVGLLNVVGVALLYAFLRRYVSKEAAIGATLLYAASPWGVVFSRKIWAQNMLPPFVIATIYVFILGFVERRRWAQVLAAPLLVITGQIHYGAFVIIPAVLTALWRGRKIVTRFSTAGLVLAALMTIPYIVGLQQAGLLSPSALIDALGEDESDSTSAFMIEPEAIRQAGVIVSGYEIHSLAGPNAFQDYLATVPDLSLISLIIPITVLVSATSLAWMLFKSEPSYDRTVLFVILAWLVFPVAIYTIKWTSFYIHYLIPMLPAAFIVLAFGANQAAKLKYYPKRLTRVGGIGLIILQIWSTLGLFSFIDTTFTPGGFGTPLKYLLQVRTDLANEDRIIINTGTAESAVGFDNEATVWRSLLYGVAFIQFEPYNTAILPSDPTLTLSKKCTGDKTYNLRSNEEGCYSIESRSARDITHGVIPLETPAHFEIGAKVVGYSWHTPTADQICLSLYWQATTQVENVIMFSIHMMDSDGERIAIADGLSLLPEYWYEGDMIERTFCISHVDALTVQSATIGMYRMRGAGQIEAFSYLDEMGNPAGQNVSIKRIISHSQ